MEAIKEFPLVSIFAVCHKHAPYVLETLDSIRNQTYPNIELIIINNLKDECEIIIKNWIDVHNVQCFFIQNENPKTVTQNCNIGLENCNGKYFQGISCDDVLLPQKIKKQVALFELLPEDYACIYGDENMIDENGNPKGTSSFLETKIKKWGTKHFPEGDLKNELSLLSFVPAPSVLLKTLVVKALGSYDEEFIFEDWPMWIKLSKNGYKFAAVREVVVNYRILATSMDRTRSHEFYKTILLLYNENADFFNIKDEKVRSIWHKYILAQKKYSYRSSFYNYIGFFKKTHDFSLRKFLTQIKPYNVRKFVS